jgi:aminopeptidase YwaD
VAKNHQLMLIKTKNRLYACFLFLVISVSTSRGQTVIQARNDIKTLCSKRFYGRGYIYTGNQKAAKFLANVWEKSGLKPFKGRFLHPLPTPAICRVDRKPKVTLNGTKLKAGTDYLIYPASGSGSGNTSKNFVKVHFQKAPYLSSEISYQSHQCLIYLEKNLTASLSFDRLPIPVIQLKRDTFLTTDELAYSVSTTLIRERNEVYNVCGYLKGKDTTSWMIIAAHYDHLGGYPGGTYFPGASDNASGMALLMAVLRTLTQNAAPPPCNVLFLAFTGEEVGLWGSAHFVKENERLLPSIQCLLNLDICSTGDEGITVVNATIFKEEFDRLNKINKEENLLPKVIVRGKAPISDHHYFTEAGVPSLYLYTQSKSNHYYHDVRDQPKTISLSHFEALHRLIIRFVTE